MTMMDVVHQMREGQDYLVVIGDRSSWVLTNNDTIPYYWENAEVEVISNMGDHVIVRLHDEYDLKDKWYNKDTNEWV